MVLPEVAPTLLRNFGIENKIDYILDDHQMKIEIYSCLSNKIISTKNLLKMMPDLIVILEYLHNKK